MTDPLFPDPGWIPAGESISFAGRDLGGMIYVGTPPLIDNHDYRDECWAYIDPSLQVARSGIDRDEDRMPYWPGYSGISPRCRATYLDWLAKGRSDPSCGPGCMLLYFYGIERRFFVDTSPEEEKAELLEEARRLSALHTESRSVQHYLGEFIKMAEIVISGTKNIQPIFENPGWGLPSTLKIAIGARIASGDALTAEWVLSWIICHPDFSGTRNRRGRLFRTPATRCPEEFKALFKLRFEERYPDGLKVRKPEKVLAAEYWAASREFTFAPEVNGKPIPDIAGSRKPIKIAQEIVEEVTGDLGRYSRFLGRNPDGRGSVEAHACLPAGLWSLFPSREMEELRTWASAIVTGGGLIPVTEVVERLGGRRTGKLSRRQLTDVADVLARLGFGLAPDPRFALRSPKSEEPVVVFELGEPIEKLGDVAPMYRSALIELALATFVAHADGRITDSEHQSLIDRVASVDDLSEHERRRLRANLDWFLVVPPDLRLLCRKLKGNGPESDVAVRTTLVSAAHADGIIHFEEIAQIEKVYKALGLDPALVYSDLHAEDIEDTPRSVRAAQPGAPGEAIPDEKKSDGATLDASRIATIRSNTERVSSVLGQIFADTGDPNEDTDENLPTILDGLDQKHAALVRELIEREHWTEEKFEQLCARHRLFVAGALEVVNEWAFEAYGQVLVDEYDGYDITTEVADALRTESTQKEQHVQAEAT